jgi:DNA-binding HxlR family transcriptional regulator
VRSDNATQRLSQVSRRPGGEERGLELLRSDLNRAILGALDRHPKTEGELKGWLVLRSPGKLRRHLATLLAAGAIDRRELRRLRRQVQYSLTDSGARLVEVMSGVEHWLARHPERDLDLVSPIGWRAFGVLGDAWSAGVIQLLSVKPRDQAHLASATKLSPHKLERELRALEGAGLIAATARTKNRPVLYRLSEWGARGVAVLAFGSYWERTAEERPVAVSPADVVAALFAALPLVRAPQSMFGVCSLTVEPESGAQDNGRSAALRVAIAGGAIVPEPTSAGQSSPDAWLHGTVRDWLAAAVEGRRSALHGGGRPELTAALLFGLHRSFNQSTER